MSGRFARRARNAAIAAGAAALLLALAVWGLARSGVIDPWLTAQIAPRLAPWLHFTAARAVWWPRLAVVLDDVAVAPATDAPPVGTASAAAVTCRVRLRPLLAGEVEIGAVHVDGLHLAVERGADGRLRAGGLETLAERTGGGGPGGLFPSAPRVAVEDGRIDYRDDAAGAEQTARLRAVEMRLAPSGSGVRIELAAQVDGGGSVRVRGTLDSLTSLDAAQYNADIEIGELAAAALLAWLPPPLDRVAGQGHLRLTAALAGRAAALEGDTSIELFDGAINWAGWQAATPLRVSAHATWDGGTLSLSQGRLEAARLGSSALAAEALHATFAYGDGALRIDTAEMRACGGTWQPAGRVTLSDPPRIDGTLRAEGVDGAELARSLSAFGIGGQLPQLTAPLRLSVSASGVAGRAWTGAASLETDGGVTWSDARLDGPMRIAAYAQIDGAALTLSNGHLRARRGTLGRVTLDAIDGNFAYDRAGVHVTPLRATAFGGTWTYSGTLPLGPASAWSGALAGTRISVAALRSALAEPDDTMVDGAVDLNAQLTGRDTRAVSGTVTARLGSAALTWGDVRVDAPAEASAALRSEGTRLAISNGKAQARGVRVRELSATDAGGTFSYSDATARVSALDARAFGGRWQASGTITLGATPTWNANVQARHIDFGALLHSVARAPDGPQSPDGVADLTLSITSERDGDTTGSATVGLTSGSFAWEDLHVDGPARANGAFSVRGETISLTQATADASRATYGPVVAHAAAGKFQYAKERLTFDELHFTSCGGKWTHSGWFTLDDGGQFAGQLGIEGAAPRELAAMLGMPGSELSFARIDLDSEFVGQAVPDWLPQLRATGSVFLSDGTMPSAAVLRPIWQALVGPGRVMNALDRSTTRVQQVSNTFTLRRGQVDTTDLTLTADDYHATALGSIGLDGRLDLRARIQLTLRGVQKMVLLGSIPLPTSVLPGLPPIPARVTGSFADPLIRPDLSALPTSTVRWLGEELLHTPNTLGEHVGHGLGQLWDGARRVFGLGAANQQPPPAAPAPVEP